MLEKSESLVKQSSSFSIDSLLSSDDRVTSMASLLRVKNSSSPPPLQSLVPHQFLFPQLVPPGLPAPVSPVSPANNMIRPNNNNQPPADTLLHHNIPLDLLARSYMSNILGKYINLTLQARASLLACKEHYQYHACEKYFLLFSSCLFTY